MEGNANSISHQLVVFLPIRISTPLWFLIWLSLWNISEVCLFAPCDLDTVTSQVVLPYAKHCVWMVSGQRARMDALVSVSPDCVSPLCTVVPVGPAIHRRDISIRCIAKSASPDGGRANSQTVTLSLAILPESRCQGKWAVSLSASASRSQRTGARLGPLLDCTASPAPLLAPSFIFH